MTDPSTAGGTPLILVNPGASKLHLDSRRQRIVHDVTAAVRQRVGREPRLEDGSRDACAEALASMVDAPLVVVVGGDGTVRDAAAGLVGRETPLAIIPAGTGNVLAHGMGIRGVSTGIDAIRTGRPRRLDLGLARRWEADRPDASGGPHELVFTVACGMGLDARIMAAAEHEWKRRLQFGAYVGAAIRELTRLQASRFRIVADGDAFEMDGYLVLVANAGELIPGRIGPRRPIDPTDGLLDLIVLGGATPLTALRGATELMVRSGHQQGRVIRRAVRHVSIESEPAQPIETDGDPHPAGRLEATVIPGALAILTTGP